LPLTLHSGCIKREALYMPRPYVVEDGCPGRPKTEIDPKPPVWFCLHDELMEKLDARGWYRQLGERRLLEETGGAPPDDNPELQQITDPEEIDRLMCRTDVVAECKTLEDLEVARFNGRLVVEIDPAAPNDLLFPKIDTLLGARRALFEEAKLRPARHINTAPWKEHRILALYDLKCEVTICRTSGSSLRHGCFRKSMTRKSAVTGLIVPKSI
jgi:hypothetical protein